MRKIQGVALSMALVAGLIVGAPGSASAKPFAPVTETFNVATDHGIIYIEVTRPMDGDKDVKGPAVLTYSPYSVLGRSNVATPWVPEGYISVFADVVGTGNSGGCWDYGGIREKETGYEIVEWIAKQDWSNGKVGMIGGSYEGTTATATAVMRPPHLTTIVPEAAISRWYGYAFSGGMRYALNDEKPTDEGLDTPLAFDFGFAIPPPIDVADPDWATKVASTITPCDEVAHTEHGYDQTPDYDDFWKERDYLKDAKKIDVPVMVVHNWGDWNVKQEEGYNLFRALLKGRSPKVVGYFGHRYKGHGTPGTEHFNKTVKQWMDHYLMGKRNGANKLPTLFSEQANYDEGKGLYSGPIPKTRNVKLYAVEVPITSENGYQWQLSPGKYQPNPFFPPSKADWPMNAPNAESHANHHGRSNHEWQWWESPPLKKDTRVFGQIKVKMYSKVFRKWVTMTPVIVDMDHACHTTIVTQHTTTPECTVDTTPEPLRAVHPVTRGFLDSRYRKGLSKQVMVEPGKSFGATITMKPIDFTFKKGHSIALNLMSDNIEWVLPKHIDADALPEGCDPTAADAECMNFIVDWTSNKNQVILPVVNGPRLARDLFNFAHMHEEQSCMDTPVPLPACVPEP